MDPAHYLAASDHERWVTAAATLAVENSIVTRDVRYLVVPERHEGADDLSEEELALLVTRDAMIGVARL